MEKALIKSTQRFLNWYLNLTGDAKLKDDGILGDKTARACMNGRKNLDIFLTTQGIKFSDSKNPLILIGFRRDNKFTDTFDDFMVWITPVDFVAVEASTTAGKYYVYNPLSAGGIKGTAVLIPGVYKNTYRWSTAINWATLFTKTPHFKQLKEVSIYRDTVSDEKIDVKIIQRGYFGINIHTAGLSSLVDRWSAGCQVIPRHQYLPLIEYYSEYLINGDYYTYILHQQA